MAEWPGRCFERCEGQPGDLREGGSGDYSYDAVSKGFKVQVSLLRLFRIGLDRCSRSFFDGLNLIYRQPAEVLGQAAGPANFHPFNLVSFSQPEVNPHVAVRDVTGSASNFIHKGARRSLHTNASSNSVVIRLRPDEVHG